MAEFDERYEFQQISRAIRPDETETVSNNDPLAVVDEATVLHNGSFRQSRDSSGTSVETFGDTHHIAQTSPKTSLEILECAHRGSQINQNSNTVYRDSSVPLRGSFSINHNDEASEIPLPLTSPDDVLSWRSSSMISSSRTSFETSGSIECEQPNCSSSESCNLYKKKNERLSKRFTHLQGVCSGSRHDKADITIFDYTGSVLQDLQQKSFDFMSEDNVQSQDFACPILEQCRQFICPSGSLPQVETRLVVVEDLGPSLINLLGATFDLSPEFFEEHLYRSDYRGYRASEPSPSTWTTSNLQKNYVSLAWSRPGESWTSVIEPGRWESLLGHDTARVEVVTQFNDKIGQSENVFYKFVAKTNIFRSRSELSIDPAGRLPDKVPCGLEERATLCNVEYNGIQYGAL